MCTCSPYPASMPGSIARRVPSAPLASIARWMGSVEAPMAQLLGGLFVVAGVAKLWRFGEFRESLAGYRLARPRSPVAVAVPPLAVAVGLALIAGLPRA